MGNSSWVSPPSSSGQAAEKAFFGAAAKDGIDGKPSPFKET